MSDLSCRYASETQASEGNEEDDTLFGLVQVEDTPG
jgi:hypothetical protein